MPPPHPPEFRRRAVELARERAKPIAQIAADIGISESCLRNWLAQADIDEGHKEGLTTAEREELVKLRRENRVLRVEKEILGKGQYTSWAFGRRLRAAGVLGSMGSIGDAYDNAMAKSFFSTLQRELLDEHRWESRRQLALAVFEWIEAWYNPRRRYSSIGDLSPIDYEARFTSAAAAA